MGSRRGLVVTLLVLVAVGEAAWIAYPRARELVFPSEETAAARGYQVAVSPRNAASHAR